MQTNKEQNPRNNIPIKLNAKLDYYYFFLPKLEIYATAQINIFVLFLLRHISFPLFRIHNKRLYNYY